MNIFKILLIIIIFIFFFLADGKITLGLAWLLFFILSFLQLLIGNLKDCERSRNLCLEIWI